MGSGKSAGGRRDKGDGAFYFSEKEQRWRGSFYGEDGKRHYISGPVGKKSETKRAAKAKLEAAIAADRRGQLVGSSSQTVAEYMESWLEEKRLELNISTDDNWQYHANTHIIPGLGTRQLQKLRREHIQSWISELAEKELEASSIRQIHGLLQRALGDAVRQQILVSNPCQYVRLPRIVEKEMQILSLDHARQFLSYLRENDRFGEALFTMALTTGMRQGELLSLRWSDLDLDQRLVRVQRTVKFIGGAGYIEDEPKTKGSRRAIILTHEAVSALRRHRKKQIDSGKLSPLVFPGPHGSYYSRSAVGNLLRRELAKAELPRIRFHDLRHTAATLMLLSGMLINSVQKVLGHASLQTTLRYLHFLPDMEERDISRYGESLFTKIAK